MTYSCFALFCLVWNCLVLNCLVLSYLALCCFVLSCLALSCLVLSRLAWSCPVLCMFNLWKEKKNGTWRRHSGCVRSTFCVVMLRVRVRLRFSVRPVSYHKSILGIENIGKCAAKPEVAVRKKTENPSNEKEEMKGERTNQKETRHEGQCTPNQK
jgi:hypothetical protein